MSEQYLLSVQDLHTSFRTDSGEVQAVNGVSFNLNPGEILGIVGESGSGKSVTAYSVMQILADNGSDADARARAMSILEDAATSSADNGLQPRQLRAALWLAQAHCTTSPETAQSLFNNLESSLREAQPQGGALTRQVRSAHAACPAPSVTSPQTAATTN